MLMPPLNLDPKKALAPPSDRCEKPVGPPPGFLGAFPVNFGHSLGTVVIDNSEHKILPKTKDKGEFVIIGLKRSTYKLF